MREQSRPTPKAKRWLQANQVQWIASQVVPPEILVSYQTRSSPLLIPLNRILLDVDVSAVRLSCSEEQQPDISQVRTEPPTRHCGYGTQFHLGKIDFMKSRREAIYCSTTFGRSSMRGCALFDEAHTPVGSLCAPFGRRIFFVPIEPNPKHLAGHSELE